MQLKCLAVTCSPRKDGNTSLLAGLALEECRVAGCSTELINLAEHNITPCLACSGCDDTGICIIQDDVNHIYNKILAADRLIISAPIFSMGINAQAKMLIDRAQQFWAQKYLLKQNVISEKNRPPRQGIFISCAGTTLPGVFDGAVRVIRYFFKMLEIELLATLCFDGVDKKGDIFNHPSAIKETCYYGKKISSL